MAPVVIQQAAALAVRLPQWVRDLNSFRRWAKSDQFPERGWYGYLGGELWVDPTMERFGHNQVKAAVAVVLTELVTREQRGRFVGDRMLLTNREADLATEPDGMFLSYDALRAARCRLEHGDESLEVLGSPDMVLEVVSPSSKQKDTVILRDLYWRARIREYWLVDLTRTELSLDILKTGPKGYVSTRKYGGWTKSAVFDRSFRLTGGNDPLGNPTYSLDAE